MTINKMANLGVWANLILAGLLFFPPVVVQILLGVMGFMGLVVLLIWTGETWFK